MQLRTLVSLAPAFHALGATKLPAKTAYRVAKAINALRPELAAYDDARLKLAAELGTLSEDGQQYSFGENGPAFTRQHEALLDEDCAVTLPSITPDELGDISIEAHHLAVLDGVFIKEQDHAAD